MIIVCQYCNKQYGEKDGKGVEGISHGSCPNCHSIMMKRIKLMNELKHCVVPERIVELHNKFSDYDKVMGYIKEGVSI